MASKHFGIEVTVRKVHSGDWVWRNNVQFPRENEEYEFCYYGNDGSILTSGSKKQMTDFLGRFGFEYVPRKRHYMR